MEMRRLAALTTFFLGSSADQTGETRVSFFESESVARLDAEVKVATSTSNRRPQDSQNFIAFLVDTKYSEVCGPLHQFGHPERFKNNGALLR
jgi:hypothetical protein